MDHCVFAHCTMYVHVYTYAYASVVSALFKTLHCTCIGHAYTRVTVMDTYNVDCVCGSYKSDCTV